MPDRIETFRFMIVAAKKYVVLLSIAEPVSAA
jgi:hypothetical protein